MSRGRRYDNEPKLNIKKVLAIVIAIAVLVLFVATIKSLFTSENKPKEMLTSTAYFSSYKDGKWGVIDSKGQEIIPATYDEMIIIPDNSKDIFVCSYDINYSAGTYKTKVLDKDGKIVLNTYSNVQAVQNSDGNSIWYEKNILTYKQNGKLGLINFDGNKITNDVYDNVYALDGIKNSIIIEKNGKLGLVNNSTGKVVINPEYQEIKSLDPKSYELGFIVKNDSNNYGIIDSNSKTVLDFNYNQIFQIHSETYFVVKDTQDGNYKIVDKTGQVLVESNTENIPNVDQITAINGNNVIYIQDGKYGMLNIADKKVVIEASYDELSFGYGDTLIANKENKYGIIDADESTKVDYNYSKITYSKETGFAQGEKDNFKTDIIDSNSKIVLTDVIISSINLDKGFIRVRINNDYKYYNFKFEEKQAKEVLPSNTLFLFKEKNKYGYKNIDDKVIVDPIYDDATEQNAYGFCAVNQNGMWGAIKSDGTLVLKPTVNLENNYEIDFISDWHLYPDSSIFTYTK
ncbi:MAG: WG repeat-containing protein [Clostridia bacterium]|nr:WG repeat-containing protein [Clostridia bacterium]